MATGYATSKVSADIDGDGDIDLAFIDGWAIYVSRNQGNATFAPRELVYQSATAVGLHSLIAADFDGDLDIDLAVFRGSTPGGGGIYIAYADLHRNDGSGAFTYVPGTQWFQDPIGGMLSADFDGDADQDLFVMNWGTVHILQNDGTGAFTLVDTYLSAIGAPIISAVGDIDGDLDADIVWRSASAMFTLQSDGSGHFSILAAYTALIPILLVDLDGDGDLDLLTSTSTPAAALAVSLNDGSGIFGPGTLIAGYTPPSFLQEDAAAHDLDADGDADIVVSSYWAPPTVLRNFGNATFEVVSNLATDTSNPLREPVIADLDADGDVDLLLTEYGSVPGVRRYRGCRTAGEPLCLGDGSGTACPCGNNSAASEQAGCLNSLGAPGTLRAAGIAQLSNDTLVLNGSGMPNSTALYFQGTTAAGGGGGLLLGDGLRCAGGSLIRLGVRTNVGGASRFPGPSGPSLSVLGMVLTPGERIYQIWYRDTANFCAAEGYNLTNGLRVLWAP